MLNPVQPGKPRPTDLALLDAPLRRLIEAAQAGENIEPVMMEIVRSFGFDSFLYAMTTVSRPDRDSRSYFWTNLPSEWVQAYEANAYIEVDPRITETADRTAPFVWDSAKLRSNPRLRQFFDHAGQYGVRSGVVCAFCDPSRSRMGFMFNSSISPVPPERSEMIAQLLGTLMLFAARFHDIFMANFVAKGIPSVLRGRPLSPRERQCLTMAAKGLTSSDIGLKLGITERTANFHFSNIITKLDVLNRQEAIAKGVATGAINAEY